MLTHTQLFAAQGCLLVNTWLIQHSFGSEMTRFSKNKTKSK